MPAKAAADRLIATYLGQLRGELRKVPQPRRRQILDEVSAHIAEARATVGIEDEVSIRSMLDRVGDPAAIAAEAGAGEPQPKNHWGDMLVPWLLLLGGFVYFIGWFIGVGLLWASPTWRLRDKILGALIWPGGLGGLVVLSSAWLATQSCGGVAPAGQRPVIHCVTNGVSLPPALGIPAVVLLLVAPFVVAIHLERVRRGA